MLIKRKTERGQALILIVFGMVGLLAATALAIDGGNAYSDRRHAQNAADTAVMAAGLAKIRNDSAACSDSSTVLCSPAADAGLGRAANNGYTANVGTTVVHVYQCSDPASSCTLPATEPDGSAPLPSRYVQVIITSTIPTYFARVVGVPQITNTVQAMAKAIPKIPTTYVNGQALVALMPGCKGGGWPNFPFEMGGNSVTIVNDSGIFVNSSCTATNAFDQNGSSSSMTAPAGICVVGATGATTNVNPPPQGGCGTQVNMQTYSTLPVDASSCPSAGQIATIGPGQYVATPGRYNSSFPPVSPAGNLKLQPGIYCLNNGLSINSGWTITSDLNGNGTYDGSAAGDPSEGVLLYVPNGNVTFNGGSKVNIGAMNKDPTNPVRGYLIYVPPSNPDTVQLAGNGGSSFVGTVYAPASLVTLEGNADTLSLDCQIIGYSIKLTGSGTLSISYDQSKNGIAYYNPVLQLYK